MAAYVEQVDSSNVLPHLDTMAHTKRNITTTAGIARITQNRKKSTDTKTNIYTNYVFVKFNFNIYINKMKR